MQEDEKLIVGACIPEGCTETEYKWVFTEDGKCYDYSEGKLYYTHAYSIRKFRASNGVVFSYLKTVNVNDPSDIYEYDINGLSKKIMYLDYLGDINCKLSKFTRK